MSQTSRDFVPWRFSAAGCLSAWIDLHPGGRKPSQKQTCHTSVMPIHHDEVAVAEALLLFWGNYAAGKMN